MPLPPNQLNSFWANGLRFPDPEPHEDFNNAVFHTLLRFAFAKRSESRSDLDRYLLPAFAAACWMNFAASFEETPSDDG
jgi:hypothetical protein